MLDAPPALVHVIKLPLSGTRWQLVSINRTRPDVRRAVSFNVSGTTLGVYDGCNGSGGPATITATTIRALDPQVGTAIACLKTVPLPALFRRGARYQRIGSTLILTGDGKVWKFKSR